MLRVEREHSFLMVDYFSLIEAACLLREQTSVNDELACVRLRVAILIPAKTFHVPKLQRCLGFCREGHYVLCALQVPLHIAEVKLNLQFSYLFLTRSSKHRLESLRHFGHMGNDRLTVEIVLTASFFNACCLRAAKKT